MNMVGWCASWVAGCGAGLIVLLNARNVAGIEPVYGQGLLLLALACLFPAAIAWPHKPTRWRCLLAMAALGGCGAALLSRPPITSGDLAFYNTDLQLRGPRVLVIGEIKGEPVLADKSQRFRFSAQAIRLSENSIPYPVKGDLYAVVTRYPEYAPGTRLTLSGTLTAPPALSRFDYAAYLARLGIFSYMSFPRVRDLGAGDGAVQDVFLAGARSRVRDALQRGISEPQAALTVGVVTGDRSQIPNEVKGVFLRSGITHIIAISGQNIALLTGIVWLFFGAKSKRRMTIWAFLVSTGVIVIYTAFTGASPSVVRAAVMGVILLLAPVVHRRYDPVAALSITATLMVMLDPDVLSDAGFQLSFAAMLGIALLASPLYDLTQRLKVPGILGLPIAVSLAAQGATLPLSALISGQISLVALPATLAADIALLPLMITGIAAGVIGAIFTPLAVPFGLLAWPWAEWILWWADFWGKQPWAAVDLDQIRPTWVIAYYAILIGCIWLVKQRSGTSNVRERLLTVAASIAALIVWVELADLVFS